ncbi:MAG TPA: DEAD/DEAH box helicase [Candidatus Limnocylindria bacterium]|nr:DEAD/DEAH box helicase [Candidatus Limnocylindria bacterium]
MPAVEQIVSALRGIRAPAVPGEADLHTLAALALTEAGIPFRHEAFVAPRCRIDFLAGSVGIEIKKSRPNAKALLDQATRYLASPLLDALVIVTQRDPGLPGELLGKPCVTLALARLFGVAVETGKSNVPMRPPAVLRDINAIYTDAVQELPPPNEAALPSYLLPVRETGRVYGTLSYSARGRHWVIKGDPAVTEMAKRLFPGSDGGRRGEARFADHRRLVGEANWLMQRWPLAVLPRDRERWDSALAETRAHYARLEEMRREPPAFYDPDGSFLGTLRPFQEYGAGWLVHTRRALLADEMGLGKTVQTLAALASGGGFPAVVVVPPHLVTNWRNEILRFLSLSGRPPRVHVMRGLTPSPLPEADVYIIHYLLLRGWKEALPRFPVKAVVFDEIQELRRRGTEKYSAASLLSGAADRVYGLSGTPIYNQGGEIWNVVNILDYHLLGDWESFTREWCYGYGNSVVAHPEWLGDHLRREGLMLRRTKADVLPELPDKRRLVQAIDMDDALFQRLMQPVVRELSQYAQGAPGASARALAEARLSQGERQATGLSKAPYAAAFTRALLEGGEKVLLFAHHHAVMDALRAHLGAFRPVFITGRESQAAKDEAVLRFMDGATDLCCVSLRSASGLNLQRATCVVFGELDWSPAVHSQAEDRAHRIGQKDSLLCYYLVTAGGSDGVMQDALGLKVSQFLGLMGDSPSPETEAAAGAMAARRHVEDMLARWLPGAPETLATFDTVRAGM